jgi:hypothetical protein
MTAKEVHDLFLDLRQRVRSVTGTETKMLMHADPAPIDTPPSGT